MNSIAVPLPTNEIEQHRRTVRMNPRDANAHALLGIALLRQGELAEGAASVLRALDLNPKLRGLHAVLGAAMLELGELDAAQDYYRQALRFQDTADLHKGLADTLLRAGHPIDAEQSARRAVELAPDNTAMLLSLVAVLHRQGKNEEAIGMLRRVVELDPGHVDAHYDLAFLLHSLHRYENAIEHYRAAVERRPDHFKAHHQMGLAHQALKQKDAATASLQRARELRPDDAAVLADLGGAEQVRGDLTSALDILRHAVELQPDNMTALRNLAHALFTMGEWEEAVSLAWRMLELEPSPHNHSIALFMLSHSCHDGTELTRKHFEFGERWETPLRSLQRPHANDRDPHRQLRIGFVSGDLYTHAVSRFVTPMFEAMADSEQVSLYVYYNNVVEDGMTAKNRGLVKAWRPIVGLNDEQADKLIREDGIDILIDLSGHSGLNRLTLFARKPAPVQATWIGYAGTTGLRAMDYILADRFLLPEGRYDDQFSEQIVRLPMGTAFMPEQGAPEVNGLPALKNGYLTFGSFHRASKLNRGVIAQWSKLLHAIPDSKMLLGGMQTGIDDVLIDWFAAEGVGRERLLFRPRAKTNEYMRQHYDVDICLSPFPYTGSTTVGNALWMGVPTLATVGATNPSYAATVFMTHLGLNTFITEDDETYVKLGVFLSQNLSALAAMRATMRDRFLKSVLGYPGVAAAGLELGLRKMWQRWCAGEAPAPLRVELSELVPESAQSAA
nr:tetratricopeptide repeat protein [uncultured Massilia sp.]